MLARNACVPSQELDSLMLELKSTKNIEVAKQLHDRIVKSGKLQGNTYLSNLLIQMYGKCNSLENAHAVFDKLTTPNVFSWNFLIKAYIHNGRLQEARILFDAMSERDVVSWNSMLAGYAHAGHMNQAEVLFESMPGRNVISWTTMLLGYAKDADLKNVERMFSTLPHPNVVSWNVMIMAYAQNRYISEAWNTFSQMPMRDLVSWNSMIAGFCQEGKLDDATHLFASMPVRDSFSWNAMVSSHVHSGDVIQARELFDWIPEKDVVSWNAMLLVYTQCRKLLDARELFDQMRERSEYSWNIMITAYAEDGQTDHARQLFERMPFHSLVTWNALITGYMLNGDVHAGLELFTRMPDRDQVSWNAIVAGFAQNGHARQAFHFFLVMDLEGMVADAYTFVSVLDACSCMAALSEGRMIHEEAVNRELNSLTLVATALVNMYGKAGQVYEAERVFFETPSLEKDLVLWNAMINIYSSVGDIEMNGQAQKLFQKLILEGLEPDVITFTGVLTACCHAGLVEDGCGYFACMDRDYGVSPTGENYVCVVDLVGRSGWLDEAQELIARMKDEASVGNADLAMAWRALAAACSLHGDEVIAASASKNVTDLDPKNSSGYVLLSHGMISHS